ncbi:MAG: GNAT family N-acetyltransferase [Candidatus Zixiibacteriota bacterium]
MNYKENYWDSPVLKAEFISFLERIHGVDLTVWNDMGFWDNDYRPCCYFAGESMVSNVCLYSMDMIVNGKPLRAGQISAVGTHLDFRRRGLSYDLTQKALRQASDSYDFYFLYADTDARRLYEKCGFRSVEQFKCAIDAPSVNSQRGAVRLNTNEKDHVALIWRLVSEREPVSLTLGCLNSKLFMFWILCYLHDCIYHIPELDVLIVTKMDGGVVTVYDIIGSRIPPFADIYPYIKSESDRSVEFLFMTDRMQLESERLVKVADSGAYVMGDFELEGRKFLFPFTSQA